MNEAFEELISLADFSVGCRAILRSLLDDPCELGIIKIDRVATNQTSQTIYVDQPSDSLLDALAAARALNENDSCVSTSIHGVSPRPTAYQRSKTTGKDNSCWYLFDRGCPLFSAGTNRRL